MIRSNACTKTAGLETGLQYAPAQGVQHSAKITRTVQTVAHRNLVVGQIEVMQAHSIASAW
jgi:hypothetical protein